MMASTNPLNVFSGPNALRDYFDPGTHPLIPLVEIPKSLNPLYEDNVRIYAKMMSMHPANNVKILPAMNMLSEEVNPGNTKTVIEYSSGSTVISLALASRIFHGISDVRAFLSNKTSSSKLKLMQFFGLDVTLFGGPSQPEPLDKRGGIYQAALLAQQNEQYLNANQYENDANWQAHVKWTGPQIDRQLPNLNIVCAGMGTSGTMTGIGQYFKHAKPSVLRLGVCTKAGDRVPGPRSYALLNPVDFPWRDSVDAIEEVGSKDAFTTSLSLCREGIICGPSSGFNLYGLLNHLERQKRAGTLSELAGADGLVNCAFICCEYVHLFFLAGSMIALDDSLMLATCSLPYQYVDEYFTHVDKSAFHQIRNHNLAAVDLYRYDEAWELDPTDAIRHHVGDKTTQHETILLDLRKPNDFVADHIHGAYNLPLQSLQVSTASPFSESAILESQWKELDAMFSADRIGAYDLTGKNVGVICYHGDTARVATSILRAKGIAASSIRGGFVALTRELQRSQSTSTDELFTRELSKRPEVVRTDSVVEALEPTRRGHHAVSVEAP